MTMLRTTSLRISCVLAAAILTGAAPPALAQVAAGDVVDRPSLRAFVERAHALAEALVAEATTEDEAYLLLDAEFRPMGEWHEGPIYLFALLAEGPDRGTNVFHAANPASIPRPPSLPSPRSSWCSSRSSSPRAARSFTGGSGGRGSRRGERCEHRG